MKRLSENRQDIIKHLRFCGCVMFILTTVFWEYRRIKEFAFIGTAIFWDCFLWAVVRVGNVLFLYLLVE